MKNIVLLSLTLTLLSTISLAQDYVGIKAGVNYSNLITTQLEGDLDGRVGYHCGLILKSIETEDWAIQIEFLYSQKGTIIRSEENDLHYKLDVFQNNIIYNRILNDKVSLSSGVFWASTVRNKSVIIIDNEKTELDEQFNLKTRTEVGGLLRLEYSFSEYLSIVLDYNLSILHFIDINEGRNNVFSLGVHGFFAKG